MGEVMPCCNSFVNDVNKAKRSPDILRDSMVVNMLYQIFRHNVKKFICCYFLYYLDVNIMHTIQDT